MSTPGVAPDKRLVALAAVIALVGAVVVVVLASLADRPLPSAMPVETVRNPLAL